jgi:hypothetical protein
MSSTTTRYDVGDERDDDVGQGLPAPPQRPLDLASRAVATADQDDDGTAYQRYPHQKSPNT